MADLIIDANAAATAARAAGRARLSDEQLAGIRARYRGAVAKGITDNTGNSAQIARDRLRLARRFRDQEDMILRFTTDLAVGLTSNQAEREVRPVKVQQHSSGGTWRTLLGLPGTGAGPVVPGAANDAGHAGKTDPRLRPLRHHHAVRRARHRHRAGDQRAAPPAPGGRVEEIPAKDRP